MSNVGAYPHTDYTAEVHGIDVYVQPGGCVEVSDTDDDVVHVCKPDWPNLVEAVERIRKLRLDRGDHVGMDL